MKELIKEKKKVKPALVIEAPGKKADNKLRTDQLWNRIWADIGTTAVKKNDEKNSLLDWLIPQVTTAGLL